MPPQQPQPNPAFVQQPLTEIWFDTTGGVNSFDNPAYLQENEAAGLQNADIDKRGIRQRRLGCVSYGGIHPGTGVAKGVLAGYVHSDSIQLMGLWGRKLYASYGLGEWWQCSSGYTLGSAAMQDMVIGRRAGYDGPVIYVCGVDKDQDLAMVGVHYYNTSTLVTGIQPSTIAWYQGRLWGAGGAVGYTAARRNAIIWSDMFDGLSWDVTRTVYVNAGDGDEITKLLPARGDGTQLYIFKNRSVWALSVVWGTGVNLPATENTIDTTNSQLRQISESYGTMAPRSVQYVGAGRDSDIFFLARDGVRSLRRVEQDVAGGAGAPVSDPISDVIDSINWNYAYKAAAAVWDNKYFLALPISSASINNTVVVYDLLQKRWIGTYPVAVLNFAPMAAPASAIYSMVGEEHLFFAAPESITDAVLGNAASTVSLPAIYGLLEGTTYADPGATNVVYQEDSRGFAFGDYGLMKSWDMAEYIFDAPSTTISFSVYAKVDESYWALIKEDSIAAGTSLPTIPQSTGWSAVTTPFQHKQIGLTMCPPGHQIQLRLSSPTQAAFGIRGLRVRAWPQADLWTGA